mgnify:CR=1 FL=1
MDKLKKAKKLLVKKPAIVMRNDDLQKIKGGETVPAIGVGTIPAIGVGTIPAIGVGPIDEGGE